MIKCKVTMIDGKKHYINFSKLNTIAEVRVWMNGGEEEGAKLADYIAIGNKTIINRHHIIRLVRIGK